jgi:alkylation response protein AidB-like acyl-CoA dehydrogenase
MELQPEAGSDLASLTTRAVRDGDEWVISGQKTFTTWGSHADLLYCAARTDPEAPRHHHLRAVHRPARGHVRAAAQHRRRPHRRRPGRLIPAAWKGEDVARPVRLIAMPS